MTCPCLPGSNCAECDFQPGLGLSNDMDLGTPDFQAVDFQWMDDWVKFIIQLIVPTVYENGWVGLVVVCLGKKNMFFCVFCFFRVCFKIIFRYQA